MSHAPALLACLAAACLAAGAQPQAGALADSVPHVGAGAAAGGYDGAGVTVAVIDTGVDASHPALAGGVAAAHDLLGGGDPSDRDGHGTGVAGIIAARGGPWGVAPGAELLSYKVSADGESVSSDLIARALGMAVGAGADVINVSLGVNRTDPVIDAAVAAAVAAGATVVAAAGNDGPADGSMGSPGRAAGAITVGATHNDVPASLSAFLEAGGRAFRASPMAGAPAPDGPVEGHVAFGGYARERDLAGGGYAGAIVLAERGSDVEGEVVYFSDKERAAAGAGAAALVVYNDEDGPFLGELVHPRAGAGYSPSIPAASLSREDGLAVRAMLGGPVAGSLSVLRAPDLVAQFSSRGPVSPFYQKPDLAAPGALINTTGAGGGHATASGTSFAAPHVAGAAALLLQRHPGLPPADVRSLLATTADPAYEAGPGGPGPAGPWAAGAGRLNASRALGAGLVVSPPHVALDFAPGRQSDSAWLSLRPLGGAAGPVSASVEAPAGVSAAAEARAGGVEVRAESGGGWLGVRHGAVVLHDGSTRYVVPAAFRSSAGAASASHEAGAIAVDIAAPEGWTYARVTATDAATGREHGGAARPGSPARVEVGANGTYWVEARIEHPGGTAGAFAEVEVDGAPAGRWPPPGGAGIPDRQLAAVAAAAAAAVAAAAALRLSGGRRRAPRAARR